MKEGLIYALNFTFKDLPFTTGFSFWTITRITTSSEPFSIIHFTKTTRLIFRIITRVTADLPSEPIIDLVITATLTGQIITDSPAYTPE
ncbi:MAG: hypothetical protein BWY45_01829 [Euryarchaeota archaeon ADurb.Bin294]|nr:MAG: hypothetical protein BWY45_01829 [Euryarchaeota archaeon ADurb.Bin294]